VKEEAMSIKAAAQVLDLTYPRVHQLLREGVLEGWHQGYYRLVSRASVLALLEKRQADALERAETLGRTMAAVR
jgi:excisionase family DNA binding protein